MLTPVSELQYCNRTVVMSGHNVHGMNKFMEQLKIQTY
jgi:hypothetical protein